MGPSARCLRRRRRRSSPAPGGAGCRSAHGAAGVPSPLWLGRSSRMTLSFRGALWVRASAWSRSGPSTTRPITVPGCRALTISAPLQAFRMVDGRPSVGCHLPRTCGTCSATGTTLNDVWVLRTPFSMIGTESLDACTSTVAVGCAGRAGAVLGPRKLRGTGSAAARRCGELARDRVAVHRRPVPPRGLARTAVRLGAADC